MANNSDTVIVVGAGPVGLTAALALARRGIPTIVLEAEREPVLELRGSTFHPPTLDMLDEFGIVPRMIEVGLKAPTWQFRDRETGPVATFDLSLLAGSTSHPPAPRRWIPQRTIKIITPNKASFTAIENHENHCAV